ncbi:MAG: SpoIIE family protein phosphatase [Chlorobi bacterium]|nr:SpoIIE family protein phosphatase [Chlorobiota bacterium]
MVKKASLKRLQFCNFKLDFLLEITLAINENLSTEELLKKFEKILREDLNIGKLVVYSYNVTWNRILVSGIEKNIANKISLQNDLLYYTQITNLTTTLNPYLSTFDVIIPVFHQDTPLAYVIIGDIDEERVGISPTIKHLQFIQTLANIIIVAIENKRLFNENVRQETMKRELEMASKMQSMLIPNPDSFPDNKVMYLSAYYHPHLMVGGDYYDFIELDDDNFGFCIADVSGKGMSAAILMSNFQANLRALWTTDTPLSELALKLNKTVMKNANGEKFITVFLGKYNCKKHVIHYINAGHNPPLFKNNNTGKVEYLKTGCIGIGMLEEIPTIEEGSIEVVSNSKILCYTDGIVEMESEKQVEFGTDIMEEKLLSNYRMDNVIENIISELNVFKGKNNFFDDIALLGIDFH